MITKNKITRCMASIAMIFALHGTGKAAMGYFTTASTGVLVSSFVPYVFAGYALSTGGLNNFVVFIDSNTQFTTSTGASLPSISGYPISQWITPQIVFQSTTAANGTWTQFFTLPGIGVVPDKGLFIYQSNTGNTVTVYLKAYGFMERGDNWIDDEEAFRRIAKNMAERGLILHRIAELPIRDEEKYAVKLRSL